MTEKPGEKRREPAYKIHVAITVTAVLLAVVGPVAMIGFVTVDNNGNPVRVFSYHRIAGCTGPGQGYGL